MKNNPELFVYWLQGYAELCGERPSEIQWEMIKEHLDLVFNKETKLKIDPNLIKARLANNKNGNQPYC